MGKGKGGRKGRGGEWGKGKGGPPSRIGKVQSRQPWCHMGSHPVTCHPAELTFLPLPQHSWYSIYWPRRDARPSLPSWLISDYILRWYTHLNTVTHPSTNRARCWLTAFLQRMPLTSTPCCQPIQMPTWQVTSDILLHRHLFTYESGICCFLWLHFTSEVNTGISLVAVQWLMTHGL